MTFNTLHQRLARRGLFHIRPGLDKILKVLAVVGNPQNAVTSIHIAGTNGKGSVAAGLESILRQSGLKVGLYTSPHLVDVRERIQINRTPISLDAFTRLSQALFKAESTAKMSLTYFEFLTALAFLHFARESVDVMVIETGMGGRWDATNVIQRPALSVITSIGLDHTRWLGKTETSIAREKAGILKPGTPTVSGVRGPARQVITHEAVTRGIHLREIDYDFSVEHVSSRWTQGSQRLRYTGWVSTPRTFEFGLLGSYQVDNAGIILAAVELLNLQGWKINQTAVKEGLRNVIWPGRLQLFHPLNGPAVLLDGAHNPPAVDRLLESLETSPWRHCAKTFVCGVYRDKDHQRMMRSIQGTADRIIVCTLPGKRSLSGKTLAASLHAKKSEIFIESQPIQALQKALRVTKKNDLVVVCGSLSLVGTLLPHLAYGHPLLIGEGTTRRSLLLSGEGLGMRS